MTVAAAEDRDRVGPYRLVKAIGAGGSARIDLARIDRAYGFQRHVVVKRPLEHLREDPRAAASLRREARIGGLLRHPNLVSVLDAGSHDGYEYLVLEYVHGGSLRTLMQAPGDAGGKVRDCPLAVAIAIAIDVAWALDHAHELADEHGAPLGLVHRDVSPGNVLVALDGAVKLADFGIAKETRVATLSGSMHGTVTYMAPEQCRGHAFDRRADVFSLGVILYELITGSRLFWADNDVASLHRVLSGNVPRPRKVQPAVSAALEDIVLTAVAHDPDRRFATARALAEALEAHAEDAGVLVSARAIAGWAEAALGKRDVPWLAAATLPDPVPPVDGSLVELIQATPDEPPPETFGPSDGRKVDHASDRRPPDDRIAVRRRRRIALGAVIAAGLVAGSAVTAIVMTRDTPDREVTGRPAPAEPPGQPTPAPRVEAETLRRLDGPAPAPPVQADTTPRLDEPAPRGQVDTTPRLDEPAPRGQVDTTPRLDEPAPHGQADPAADAARSTARAKPKTGPPKQAGRDPRRAGSAAATGEDHAPSVSATGPTPNTSPAPATPDPGARSGSGSAATRPPVKWDPTLLLPTDTKIGSGSRR